MFRLFSSLFRRSRELEADLHPTPDCTLGGKGEIEIETWSDGAGRLEASIAHTGLPNGAQVDVFCGEHHVTSLVVQSGYAKAVIDKPADGAGFDETLASIGAEASFRHDGATIYRGIFRPD